MKDQAKRKSQVDGPNKDRAGMTLIEVVIAMALVALACGGLYAVGIKARQFAEHNRLANEARSLAKEQLEYMIACGATALARNPTDVRCDTNYSSLNYPIVRQPSLVWHAADGAVVTSTNAAYVEARVNVTYTSPLMKNQRTDSFSMLVTK
jgi:prepilin-type N-terminal cleavage/methylation domain-containing protein